MYGDPTADADPSVAFGHDMPFYTRDWHFDPYHQRLTVARRGAPHAPPSDTERGSRARRIPARRGEHHPHAVPPAAPGRAPATRLHTAHAARRGPDETVSLGPRDALAARADADADMFEHTTDKMYRDPAGFQGLSKKTQEGRERMGDEAAEGGKP